jgi:bifunctional enzyme CysN/CysC
MASAIGRVDRYIAGRDSRRRDLRFLTCGSVDDGKSTLIGRLIHDASGLFEDQLAALQTDSRQFGTTGEGLDFALLLDGLEAEREQGITIDVAWRFFATAERAFIVADTPGHQQYTRNMATGASNAELAVLLLDVRKGLLAQTRHHAAIVSLLGIRHVVLAVNKMDLVDFSESSFREIDKEFRAFAASLGFLSIAAVPLSARQGDNVTWRSERMTWYAGATLLGHLETIEIAERNDLPFRFPVQLVNRADAEFRGLAGTVAAGRVAVGDRIVVASSGRLSSVDRIVTFDGDLPRAEAGRAVTLTLADEFDIGRGDILADPDERPIVTRRFAADLLWMDEPAARTGGQFLFKTGGATVPASLSRIVDSLDTATLQRMPADKLELNAIGRVWIETAQPVAVDSYGDNRHTGSFILIDRSTLTTAAAGLVVGSLDLATNVHHQPQDVTPAMRADQKFQRPLVVWLTGLPGAGKSTIANLVDLKLTAAGRHTMLLDGDNLRQGLNADLGFDAPARSENVRRVAETAKLMVDAGLIVIVALVSPFRADRARAAALLPEGHFLEVFVDTPLEVCQQRDVKGLYRKAAAGRVTNVTGLDQCYEVPEAPALVLPTGTIDPEEAATRVLCEILARMS